MALTRTIFSSPPPLTREFSISYTGELYAGQRDPTLLFEVLRELIEDGTLPTDHLRVRFYGRIESWLPALVERYGLNQVVSLHGPTARVEAVKRQQESQVLLLLPWQSQGNRAPFGQTVRIPGGGAAHPGSRRSSRSHHRDTGNGPCRIPRLVEGAGASILALRLCRV
jgi:hypothetical protein